MTEYEEYAEAAAQFSAEVSRRMGDQVPTGASLRKAIVGAMHALLPPAKIERDPDDPSRFNLWLPLDLAKHMGLVT